MKKNIAKNQILEACKQKQQELIENFEKRVKDLKEDAFDDKESASQSEERNVSKVEMLRTFESELAFARTEMGILKSLDPSKEKTRIEQGAVVFTNKLAFFIGVSSEKIEVDGEMIYGISTQAPIYSAMDNLEKGAKFKYNNTEYEIENVY